MRRPPRRLRTDLVGLAPFAEETKMKRLAFVVMVLCLTAWLPAAAAQAGDLAGTWSLAISDYQNTCGGKPTAAKELSLKQSGRKLTAAIGVTGPDGKNYTGTFQAHAQKRQHPHHADGNQAVEEQAEAQVIFPVFGHALHLGASRAG